MKIVVDEYPKDCSTCIFKEDNFSERKNHCTILHVDIGGINDVRFTRRCHDKFILFKDAMDKYLMEKDLEVLEKEADSLSKVEAVEKKRLSFIDMIGDNKISDKDLDRFNDDMNKLLQFGKENIEKGREGTIVIPKKEADNIIKRSEEEIKKQREEALDRASKGGFLDTGSVVSIGDEIRKVKDEVRKMGANIHHDNDNKVEDTGDKTLTKEQAAEMMCENFGGLV